jgi:hypothetical protein
MGLHRRSDPRTRALDPYPAVEIVAEQGDQQHDEQCHQRPVDQEHLEGERHHVVGDVAVELGIGDPEAGAVAEQDPVVPLTDGLGADDEREHDHHADPEPPGVGADHLLIALDELVLGVE